MGDLAFGTDGWRGIIAADFTRSNVERIARAYAAFVHENSAAERGVVLGYDRRFQSDRMAGHITRVLSDAGVPTWLASSPTTTPAVSQAVVTRGAFGGLVVTASHNPPEFNGIKFKSSIGGSASVEEVSAIARLVDGPVPTSAGASVTDTDLQAEHLRHLKATVPGCPGTRRLRIVVDPMYGAASGLTAPLLRARGHEVTEIRAQRDPSFGGINPEPMPPHTDALAAAVVDTCADIGVAMDGDGDRIGAVDARGQYFSPHRIFAMLAHAALSTGQRGRGQWSKMARRKRV